jgi:hypothetical protein
MFSPSWVLRTPLGEFRLRAHGERQSLSAEEQERSWQVWCFAQAELESLSPRALEAAFALAAELKGTAIRSASGRVGFLEAQAVGRELEAALLAGRLVLEVRPHVQGLTALEASEPQPEWEPPPQKEEPPPKGAWIELELVNQDGEPVANRSFRILQKGNVVREGMTNAAGFARIEPLAPGPCDVEFPDLNATDFNYQPALPGSLPATAEGPVLQEGAQA